MATTSSGRNHETSQAILRVDGPHPMVTRGAEVPAPVMASSVVAVPEEGSEQMQLQATQLAQHLQERRRDVDQREAQLNARIAQLESELRLSRLWQREQSQEFAQREAEIRQQLGVHESRAVALAAAELDLETSRKKFTEEIQERETELARRENQIEESQQRLFEESERLRQMRTQLETERDQFQSERLEGERLESERLEDARREGEETERLLHARLDQRHDHATSDLADRERAHQQVIDQWKQEWSKWQQWMQQREQELAAEQESLRAQSRRWQEEREQQIQDWERDRKQMDQRQNTMERIRTDVRRLHRDALEMRLIAEQLWAQLAGRLAPVELTASVTKLRSQLAEEYRLATQELHAQRATLQELLTRLDQKQQELAAQRTELLDWFRRRQADLAKKSAELARRNQSLVQERQQLAEERFESRRNDHPALVLA